jgi:hypothetical protein
VDNARALTTTPQAPQQKAKAIIYLMASTAISNGVVVRVSLGPGNAVPA